METRRIFPINFDATFVKLPRKYVFTLKLPENERLTVGKLQVGRNYVKIWRNFNKNQEKFWKRF